DLLKRPSNPLLDAAINAGFRASLIVPLLSSDGPLGTLVLQRRQPGEFPPSVVNLMQSFADQSAIALENARLFDEIAQKSRELENCQPAQVPVRRQHEPRAQNSVGGDSRLCRADPRRVLWGAAREVDGCTHPHPLQRQALAGPDQYRARH